MRGGLTGPCQSTTLRTDDDPMRARLASSALPFVPSGTAAFGAFFGFYFFAFLPPEEARPPAVA